MSYVELHLVDDCLAVVCTALSFEQRTRTMRRVCRRWRDVCDGEVLWTLLCFEAAIRGPVTPNPSDLQCTTGDALQRPHLYNVQLTRVGSEWWDRLHRLQMASFIQGECRQGHKFEDDYQYTLCKAIEATRTALPRKCDVPGFFICSRERWFCLGCQKTLCFLHLGEHRNEGNEACKFASRMLAHRPEYDNQPTVACLTCMDHFRVEPSPALCLANLQFFNAAQPPSRRYAELYQRQQCPHLSHASRRRVPIPTSSANRCACNALGECLCLTCGRVFCGSSISLHSHAYHHAFSTHHLIVFNTGTKTITCFACNRVLGTGTSVERGQVATILELVRHAFGEERSTTLKRGGQRSKM
jgi:hypothetical protein